MSLYTLQTIPLTCAPSTGGVADIYMFDKSLVTFTVAGSPPSSYSAIAAVTPGDTPLYKLGFLQGMGEFNIERKGTDPSIEYDHKVSAYVPKMDKYLASYFNMLDSASICGVGLLVRTNDGVYWILGEGMVGGAAIAEQFRVTLDTNTKSGVGKKFGDQNGTLFSFTGSYKRPAYVGTFSDASVAALIAP